MLGIQAANGLEDVAKFTENAAVELYYEMIMLICGVLPLVMVVFGI